MSLLNLVHHNVVLKFTEAVRSPFDSTTGYVFRLTGVDGMGFLQVQDLRRSPDDEHETIAEPYWINKDLVREVHEFESALGKDAMKFSGDLHVPITPKPVAIRAVAPKAPKKSAKAKAAAY
jgi:hypothetical protein